jgi:hypothetical protein
MVFYGCSEEDIEVEFLGAPDKERKKCLGMSKAWRKQACAVSIELPRGSITNLGDDAATPTAEFHAAVEKIKQAAPADGEEKEGKPGLLVFFPGIPGCGKSSLLDSVMEKELQSQVSAKEKEKSEDLERKVHIRVGDEEGKNFWSLAKTTRKKDTSCIFIVDKNTPPASWNVIGNTCSETSGIPLPVLPDRSVLQTTSLKGARKPDGSFSKDTSHFYPFSLPYLAVCMARVLERKPSSHAGKLDSGTPIACMIVVMFYSFYRYMAAEDLQETLMSKLKNEGTLDALRPIEIPFLPESDNNKLPADLEEVIVEALQFQVRLMM